MSNEGATLKVNIKDVGLTMKELVLKKREEEKEFDKKFKFKFSQAVKTCMGGTGIVNERNIDSKNVIRYYIASKKQSSWFHEDELEIA